MSTSTLFAFLKNGDIWIANKDGSDLKQLTQMGDIDNFKFSSSGKKLAFTKNNLVSDNIWLIDSFSTEPQEIKLSAKIGDDSLAWSADEEEIIYTAQDNGERLVSKLDIKNNKTIKIFNNTDVGLKGSTQGSYSSDGEEIGFCGFQHNWDIYIIDKNGQNLRKLTNASNHTSYWGPTFLPNSDKLVFADIGKLFIMDFKMGKVIKEIKVDMLDISPTPLTVEGEKVYFPSSQDNFVVDTNTNQIGKLNDFLPKYGMETPVIEVISKDSPVLNSLALKAEENFYNISANTTGMSIEEILKMWTNYIINYQEQKAILYLTPRFRKQIITEPTHFDRMTLSQEIPSKADIGTITIKEDTAEALVAFCGNNFIKVELVKTESGWLIDYVKK